MLISHEYKLIFIHVGKTGGTSIKKVLCEYLNIDFNETETHPEWEWWKHIWAKDLKEYIGEEVWNNYFTFAFVRNPLDMILSLYSMYTQYPEYTDIENHEDLYHPWNQYKDFEDFILAMGECRHEPDDKWRLQLHTLGTKYIMNTWYDLENLQSTYLTDSWKGKENGEGEILVDFVGKYENLKEDFDLVCETVGLPKLNLIHHGATIHRPYHRLYTKEMAEIVYNHSYLDIERFGYAESLKKLNLI
ncbi:MAG: sulfotransferase family 2 domain-containing protein [Crocosphaera sp.]|nr:sulfotransferase family 2 domain-containing protein [Crocosphaera sp.]